MAPKIIYMRKNPDPNRPKVVEDLEKILRGSSKTDKGTFHLQRSLSLPAKCIKSIDNIIFYDKFEQTLFKSKSGSNLSQVIFDPERLTSFTLRSSSKFSKKDQEIFWKTLTCDLKKGLLNTES
jgi:hypothetical protein